MITTNPIASEKMIWRIIVWSLKYFWRIIEFNLNRTETYQTCQNLYWNRKDSKEGHRRQIALKALRTESWGRAARRAQLNRLAELEIQVLLCGTVYLQLIQSQTSECIEDLASLQAQRNCLVELIFPTPACKNIAASKQVERTVSFLNWCCHASRSNSASNLVCWICLLRPRLRGTAPNLNIRLLFHRLIPRSDCASKTWWTSKIKTDDESGVCRTFRLLINPQIQLIQHWIQLAANGVNVVGFDGGVGATSAAAAAASPLLAAVPDGGPTSEGGAAPSPASLSLSSVGSPPSSVSAVAVAGERAAAAAGSKSAANFFGLLGASCQCLEVRCDGNSPIFPHIWFSPIFLVRACVASLHWLCKGYLLYCFAAASWAVTPRPQRQGCRAFCNPKFFFLFVVCTWQLGRNIPVFCDVLDNPACWFRSSNPSCIPHMHRMRFLERFSHRVRSPLLLRTEMFRVGDQPIKNLPIVSSHLSFLHRHTRSLSLPLWMYYARIGVRCRIFTCVCIYRPCAGTWTTCGRTGNAPLDEPDAHAEVCC